MVRPQRRRAEERQVKQDGLKQAATDRWTDGRAGIDDLDVVVGLLVLIFFGLLLLLLF
jgi:hypothetical protein